MPPGVLRYETPPTTQLAHQSPQTAQTPRHRGDETRSGAPTARSRYRVATPRPPNNQQSRRRNAGQTAALPSPRPAHAPTAEAAPPIAPQPPAVHAAPEPRSHPPAYESHRRGADPTSDALRSPDRRAHRIRRLPADFATLPLLPSAGAPVRAGRYASPAVHRHTRMPTTIAPTPATSALRHHDKPKPLSQRRRIALPRTAGASTRIDRL